MADHLAMVNPVAQEASPRSGGDLDSFRAQIDLVQVAEMLTTVKRTGSGQGQILCPEHEDHRPSCTVYTDHYFCFTCKAHGDVFRLVQLLRDISFPEALDWVAEATGIARPQRSPEAEAAAATVRFFRKAFAEELEVGMELPYGLELEAARKLGLGKANQLAALVAEAPRPLLERDEVINWNGAWTLELHGRGGPLGFGAFLEARAKVKPSQGSSAALTTAAPISDETLSPAEDYQLEDEDIPGLAESDLDPLEALPTEPGGAALLVASPEMDALTEAGPAAGDDQEPGLGPFVKSRALRYPAFGGLSAARESIARRHIVLVSPDMREMLELQALGVAEVIGTVGPIDEVYAAALAKLAPCLVLVTTADRLAAPDFLPTLRRLASTGVRLELLPLVRLRRQMSEDGVFTGSGRWPVFAYLAEAAARAKAAGDQEQARAALSEWLAVLPSPSTRALYAAEAARRGLSI